MGFLPFLVGLSGDLWENIPIKEIVYWGDFLEKERKMIFETRKSIGLEKKLEDMTTIERADYCSREMLKHNMAFGLSKNLNISLSQATFKVEELLHPTIQGYEKRIKELQTEYNKLSKIYNRMVKDLPAEEKYKKNIQDMPDVPMQRIPKKKIQDSFLDVDGRTVSFNETKISAIYFLWHGEKIVYIGQSKHLWARLKHHASKSETNLWKEKKRKVWGHFSYLEVPKNKLIYYEHWFIGLCEPTYNCS